jgi:hypothetical protein
MKRKCGMKGKGELEGKGGKAEIEGKGGREGNKVQNLDLM